MTTPLLIRLCRVYAAGLHGDEQLLRVDRLLCSSVIEEDDLPLFLTLQGEIAGALSHAFHEQIKGLTVEVQGRNLPATHLYNYASINAVNQHNLPTYLAAKQALHNGHRPGHTGGGSNL